MLCRFITLFITLLTFSISMGFVLQDLPLERFERSNKDYDQSPNAFERQTRAGLIFRPVPNFLARYRMQSNLNQQ